jgi:hypothetical protein
MYNWERGVADSCGNAYRIQLVPTFNFAWDLYVTQYASLNGNGLS